MISMINLYLKELRNAKKSTKKKILIWHSYTTVLSTSKESWNNLEIDLLAKKIRFVGENNDKMRIFWFFAKKLGRLDVFDERFLKIHNNKSKNLLRQQVLEGST